MRGVSFSQSIPGQHEPASKFDTRSSLLSSNFDQPELFSSSRERHLLIVDKKRNERASNSRPKRERTRASFSGDWVTLLMHEIQVRKAMQWKGDLQDMIWRTGGKQAKNSSCLVDRASVSDCYDELVKPIIREPRVIT